MILSQTQAAAATARAERLAVSIPVRAIDPARQRFQVDERPAAETAPADSRAEAESSDADGSPQAQGRAAGGWGRGGFGLVGAFTSFLARVFSQGEGDDAPAASSPTALQAGVQAYARAAGTVAANYPGVEVLSPSLPRLSSGRALDLSV